MPLDLGHDSHRFLFASDANHAPVQRLGLFGGTGTLYAWFASIFTLPALMAVIPFKEYPKASTADFDDGVHKGIREVCRLSIFKYKRSIVVFWLVTSVY